MEKLYILAYFASLISFVIFGVALGEEGADWFSLASSTTTESKSSIFGSPTFRRWIMVLAVIFPLVFYYYVSAPVLSQGWKKLGDIRKKQGPLAYYFAVLGSFLGALIPMNAISRDHLVALVN